VPGEGPLSKPASEPEGSQTLTDHSLEGLHARHVPPPARLYPSLLRLSTFSPVEERINNPFVDTSRRIIYPLVGGRRETIRPG
jgi:hypothetical protein